MTKGDQCIEISLRLCHFLIRFDFHTNIFSHFQRLTIATVNHVKTMERVKIYRIPTAVDVLLDLQEKPAKVRISLVHRQFPKCPEGLGLVDPFFL